MLMQFKIIQMYAALGKSDLNVIHLNNFEPSHFMQIYVNLCKCITNNANVCKFDVNLRHTCHTLLLFMQYYRKF